MRAAVLVAPGKLEVQEIPDLEIGPGEVLSGLAKRVARSSTRFSIAEPDAVRASVQSLTA